MTDSPVGVISTTRADLWPLAPVISALASSELGVRVLATGSNDEVAVTALCRESGLLANKVTVRHIVPTGSTAVDFARAGGEMSVACAEFLEAVKPWIVLVLGDRWELLALAQPPLLRRIPIAHLHGGELTEGAIDDSIRHAITKLSSLHFVAAESYAARVRGLGEQPDRVHVTGAPALDCLDRIARAISEEDLATALGCTLPHPWGLMTYHAPTTTPDLLETELDAIIDACWALERIVVTAPGVDAGSETIRGRLHDWADSDPRVVLVEALHDRYPSALLFADVVIGNSSSGIVEAPRLRVPVVNVGLRQAGRLRADAVIDVVGDADSVRAAVHRALAPGFRASLTGVTPYGDGCASDRIVEVLRSVRNIDLNRKVFVDP